MKTMKIDYSRSIIEIVLSHEAISPDRAGLIFDLDQGSPEILTYSQIASKIRNLTGAIIESGLSGRKVALLFAPGLEFPLAMLACLAAGSVAVPLAPVGRRRARLQNIMTLMKQLQPDCLLVDTGMAGLFGEELADALDGSGIRYRTFADLEAAGTPAAALPYDPANLAVLQYTSGTTSSPKGVMITHGNIVANEQMIEIAFGHGRDSHFVGWLPHYHDQGLFGNILQPLYLGSTCVLTSPVAFVNRPMSWLNLISRYGAHTSGGPNFGFDLCAEHALHRGVPDLDLSSWKVAFNGAERVRPKTMQRFADCFEDVGFDKRAFMPCFGLAEGTLGVLAVPKDELPTVRSYDSTALAEGLAEETDPSSPGSIELACCGVPMPGGEVIVVDADTKRISLAGHVGEIWLKGPHIGAGYLGNAEATEATFGAYLENGEGPYMRTGDLAFMGPEGCYVVGRLKDLIILRGRNYAPSDVEHIWFELSGTVGQASAAAVQIELDSEQYVVLIAEFKRVEARSLTERGIDEIAHTLRTAVMERLELAITDLVIVPEGAIPRTTSGKVQRKQVGHMLVAGELSCIGISGPLKKVLAPNQEAVES